MRLPTPLLHRRPDSNKGDFGHIFILAGCARFSGAAVLSSWAAMRAGSGLVTLGIPKGLNNAIIKIKPLEVMTLPLPETMQGSLSLSAHKKIKDFLKNIDVLLIGPGLSIDRSTQGLVRKVISSFDKSLVIDADGLNALAGNHRELKLAVKKAKNLVITPHPGEMSRLLGVSVKTVQAKREELAKKFAKDSGATVALKGFHTLVVSPKGKLYVNKTGNPGMSTAGSGDVLAGMIASFLGQGLDGFSAAKYAVYLHGLAGDLAAEEKTQAGMLASDIIEEIPEAIKKSN
ncbi:MAG: NAD(P)H-hydrate dehydratase [Candidatus Omnitrophica bacterium]|nr:NAD(P)H-hydrate dehydratase [Candidatus Omnitrophota bacterium]